MARENIIRSTKTVLGKNRKHEKEENKRSIIEITNLAKLFQVGRFEVKALGPIDLKLYSTDFTIIFGPSGCGKSTLLNTICGLEPPSTGKVIVRDTDVYAMNENERADFRARKFGIVYQMPYWVKSLSVLDNVAIPLFLQKAPANYAYARAKESLAKVGLTEFEKHLPTELSGGQQQKVSLARALVTNPWIIVADEPTGNLDSKSASEVIQLFMDLNTKSKRTVIMVTHNLEYLPYATRTVSMIDGQIAESKHIKRQDELLKKIKPLSHPGGYDTTAPIADGYTSPKRAVDLTREKPINFAKPKTKPEK